MVEFISQTWYYNNVEGSAFYEDPKNPVYLLGQAISVERKASKIWHFEDLLKGFKPRLHLLR